MNWGKYKASEYEMQALHLAKSGLKHYIFQLYTKERQKSSVMNVSTSNTPAERTGRIGQYRIIRKIGSGGTGDVYLCRHIILENSYAVKVLHNSGNAEAQGRMLREARIARRIRHRNLVPVLDANVSVSGDTAYIVMEYIDGETLDTLLADGPLPEAAALYICRCVTLVLIEAAKHGIVHRDIKPANILIDRNGEVKLTDLGIAKVDQTNIRCDEPATCEESLLGTPDYASPEQLRDSSSVDVRADIYSLGATLYHMLSGQKPFSGSGVFNLMAQVLEENPPELQNVSTGTASLVRRMMAKDPAERPQSAFLLMKELRKVSRHSARQTPEIRRFLSGSTRRIFSIQNFRFLRRVRDIFIIAGSLFFALMICAYLWNTFKSRIIKPEKQSVTALVEQRSAEVLAEQYKTGRVTAVELISAVAGINDVSAARSVLNVLPELVRDKKYASLWLDRCSGRKHRELLKLLLADKLDVNAAVTADGTPAAFRRELFFDAELLRLLLRNGLNTAVTDRAGRTPLIRLAEFRTSNPECAGILLKTGVPLNARSRANVSAFNAAAASGNIRLARYLLSKKINLVPEDIQNIPDIYTLKSELAPLIAELVKKNTPVVQVPKRTVVSEKKQVTPVPEVKTVQEKKAVVIVSVPQHTATPEYLAKAEAEKNKCARQRNMRLERKKGIDPALNQKFKRKLEVYIQTSPSGRVPLLEEKMYIDNVIAELEAGKVDPDMAVGREQRPLLLVVIDGLLLPRRKLFEVLLASGADPDSVPLPEDRKMRMQIFEAGRSRFAPGEFSRVLSGYDPDWKSAAVMLLRGADPAEKDPVTGDNAFHRAAGLGNVEFLKLLIDSGRKGWLDVNRDGVTPFQLAVISGKGKTAHLLKKSFPDSKATGAMYNTGALFRAIEKDDPGETAYRLMLDSDPQKVNAMRLNALQYAARIGSIRAAQILLEHKVPPDKCQGDTPLLLAVKNANSELFCLLVSYGAAPDIEVTDIFGRPSLLFTEIFRKFSGDPEVLHQCFDTMLKHKWNPLVKTPVGDTPLDWMEKWNTGTPDVRKLLRSAVPGAENEETDTVSENL